MKLLKYFQYVYLVFALLFLFDAVNSWGVDGSRPYMSLLFAALATFMFFFRKKYRKRFKDRGKL